MIPGKNRWNTTEDGEGARCKVVANNTENGNAQAEHCCGKLAAATVRRYARKIRH
jgi:hypothetical protein